MFNYATVGASLLIKAILWRQSLLTNSGQAGFIITCSTTILSSLNKVLQDKTVFVQTQKEKEYKTNAEEGFPTVSKESEVKGITTMHCRKHTK